MQFGQFGLCQTPARDMVDDPKSAFSEGCIDLRFGHLRIREIFQIAGVWGGGLVAAGGQEIVPGAAALIAVVDIAAEGIEGGRFQPGFFQQFAPGEVVPENWTVS